VYKSAPEKFNVIGSQKILFYFEPYLPRMNDKSTYYSGDESDYYCKKRPLEQES